MATQQDIDKMTKLIASGVRSVTIDGQNVIYNTVAEMIKARDRLQNDLNAANATTSKPRQSYLVHGGRGYD